MNWSSITGRFLILLTAFNCFALFSSAQITFEKSFGSTKDQAGYTVRQTSDQGYVVAGTQGNNFPAPDLSAIIIKTDAIGGYQWSRTYPGTGDHLEISSDNSFLICGQTAGGKLTLRKINADGTLIWTHSWFNSGGFNSIIPTCVRQTSDNGYVITGCIGFYYCFLFKTNEAGDSLWTRYFEPGNDICIARDIRETTDSGFIIAGQHGQLSSLTIGNIFIIRTDSIGQTLWDTIYESSTHEDAFAIQPAADSGFVIAGSAGSADRDSSAVLFIKTDAGGNIQYRKCWTINGDDHAYSLDCTMDGGFVIAGVSNKNTAPWGAYALLMKLNGNADMVFTRTADGDGMARAYHVEQTSDEGFVYTGMTHGTGPDKIYLVKTNENGIVLDASPIHLTFDSIQLFPNPAGNTIRFQIRRNDLFLEVFNLQGKQMLRENIPSTSHDQFFSLDISPLQQGAYLLRISNMKGARTGKFIRR